MIKAEDDRREDQQRQQTPFEEGQPARTGTRARFRLFLVRLGGIPLGVGGGFARHDWLGFAVAVGR